MQCSYLIIKSIMEEIKFELRKTFEPTQATGLIIGS